MYSLSLPLPLYLTPALSLYVCLYLSISSMDHIKMSVINHAFSQRMAVTDMGEYWNEIEILLE